MVICGYEGSYAEKFANKNNFTFKSLTNVLIDDNQFLATDISPKSTVSEIIASVGSDAVIENKYNEKYPYLWWAVKHFENEPIDEEYLQITYPMSWEICASEANYEGSRIISDKYVENRVGAPHTWHASEMFLYLIEK